VSDATPDQLTGLGPIAGFDIAAPGPVIPRRPDALRSAIRGLDAWLRKSEQVVEFSASRRCILRGALVRAESRVALSDGSIVARGAPIVALHFWNEQMPKAEDGADIAWGLRFARQLRHSFAELAARLASDPTLEEVVALRGRFPVSGERRAEETHRFGARFGLESPPTTASIAVHRRVHDAAEDLWLWALAWAFNPGSLKQRTFLRRRDDLWMSRATLMGRYGSERRSGPTSSRSQA